VPSKSERFQQRYLSHNPPALPDFKKNQIPEKNSTENAAPIVLIQDRQQMYAGGRHIKHQGAAS